MIDPIFMNGKQIQQVIIEEQGLRGVSKTCIITKDQNGMILCEDVLEGKVGKKF